MTDQTSRTEGTGPPPLTPRKRRRQHTRLSDEEAYAGPAEVSPVKPSPASSLPTPSLTPSPPRPKRTRGSADEWIPYVKDGIRVEEKRVGGPVLCRLPAVLSYVCSDDPIWLNWSSLLSKITTIVGDHGILESTVSAVRRAWRHDTRPEKEWPITILVVAKTYTTEAAEERWHDACSAIRSVLSDGGHDGLVFEIIDLETNKATNSYPVLANDDIVRIWPSIKDPIIEILLQTDSLSLQVLRRGKDPRASVNPFTITVTVPEESSHDWAAVRDRILADVLDPHELNHLAVEIVVGRPWRRLDSSDTDQVPLLPKRAWEGPAQGGISMGLLSCSRHGTGTLGGFVEVQDANQVWSPYGLTCHHCIFPEKPDEAFPTDFPTDRATVRQYHEFGMKPVSTTAETIAVCQPSLGDYEQYIKYWQGRSQTYENDPRYREVQNKIATEDFVIPADLRYFELQRKTLDSAQAYIKMAKEFVEKNKHDLGTVYATSGLRRTDRQASIDWALIRVKPGRAIAGNPMPAVEIFPAKARDLYEPQGTTLFKSVISLEGGTDLFKIGRTTDATWGRYNGIKAISLVDWRNGPNEARRIYSNDHSVVGGSVGPEFAKGGDSGSFVFDKFGGVVGLLLAANDGTNTSFFTTLDDVFADIRQITGANDVRLL